MGDSHAAHIADSSSAPVSFLEFTREELASFLSERFSLTRYRADQLYQWVYQRHVLDPMQMTNIRKELRVTFGEVFRFPSLEFAERQISIDGTRKYLFDVADGDKVESVMIHQPDRMTLCVSSQVGCALGCRFCQTGTMGLKRHLSMGEILQQVLAVRVDAKNFNDSFGNLVFMGMGEPFHNIDNVLRAIRVLNDDFAFGLSGRKITVSTVGLVPEIRKFAESGVEANLAVSLNAARDEVRSQIMPVNRKYPLPVLLETLRNIPLRRRQRITIEYVMLAGLNDTTEDLRLLPELLRGIPCKINLIPYNDNSGLGFSAPTEKHLRRWQQALMAHGFVTTIRWSKGRDIQAACGQLVTESARKSLRAKPRAAAA